MTGFIARVNTARGFFFITPTNGDPDVFGHCKELVDLDFDATLEERRVQFEMGTDPRSGRPRAVNIRSAN